MANARIHGDDPWAQARMRCQEFMLRTWVIEHLGPDADPDWSPEALANDALAALSLEPDQAKSMTTGWRDLSSEQVNALRRHKNLTSHVDRLLPHQPGRWCANVCPERPHPAVRANAVTGRSRP